MLLFEWFPLTYFGLTMYLAHQDGFGCKLFALHKFRSLVTVVYGPILAMRLIGYVFLNKSNQIAVQIIIIYSWLIGSLSYWGISTLIEIPHING